MLGGIVKSASKQLMNGYGGDPWVILAMGFLVLFLKALLVQITYNRMWPRLVKNSGGSPDGFTPLTIYEALLVVILFTFLV
jgi:hypothetical protein